jgi:hypothetical protein
VRSRFRESDERQHLPAWWELYIYTLFRRLGYEVEPHPSISGVRGKPDFLVNRGSDSFYVECTALFGEDDIENPDGQAWVCECTNRAKNPDFMVDFEIAHVGTERPKVREITQPLEEWLATLDADAVDADVKAGRDSPRLELPVRDWKLVFSAYPVLPERRGDPRRIIAVYPSRDTVAINDFEQVHDKLEKKGSKYGSGKLDRPLVVAVLCWDAVDETDLTAALFGSLVVSFLRDDPQSARTVRIPDGYWRPGPVPRGTRVSAVLFGNTLRAWRVASELPELWINPWASTPIPELPAFATLAVDADGNFVSNNATRTAADIFGLPPEWTNTD